MYNVHIPLRHETFFFYKKKFKKKKWKIFEVEWRQYAAKWLAILVRPHILNMPTHTTATSKHKKFIEPFSRRNSNCMTGEQWNTCHCHSSTLSSSTRKHGAFPSLLFVPRILYWNENFIVSNIRFTLCVSVARCPTPFARCFELFSSIEWRRQKEWKRINWWQLQMCRCHWNHHRHSHHHHHHHHRHCRRRHCCWSFY